MAYSISFSDVFAYFQAFSINDNIMGNLYFTL